MAVTEGMLFVAAKDVREGMCVAMDVEDPQGRILIARRQRLGVHHIVRLRKFGITSLFIDPNNGENVVKATKSELREQCQKVLHQSCSKLTAEFAEKKIMLDTPAIKSAIDSLLEALLKSKNPLIVLADIGGDSDKLLQHSMNTTVLATILGIDLRVPQTSLHDLATGMLFHDVGMVFLPEEVVHKEQPLTQSDAHILQDHPKIGFDHLVRSDAISSVAASIALRHHETMDGSGYPHGATADKLSPLIRIAAVAEVYDSLTTPRFGLPRVMPDAAVTYLISNVGKLFAREAVAALCKRIALYPPGSGLKLNTGECGVVAGVLAANPMRPVVLIHIDSRGRQLKSPLVVDMATEPSYSVMKSAPSLAALLEGQQQPAGLTTVHPVYARIG